MPDAGPSQPDAAPPPADPELSGTPLSAYAAVLAYLEEGIPLEQALAHAGVEPRAWPAVEQAWGQRIAERAAHDRALLDAFDAHRLSAYGHVERPLPPIDADLAAWLNFFRSFSAREDPLGFLEERGMSENDFFRLVERWQARLDGDEALRKRASQLLGRPAGAVPEVRPGPVTLRPETRRRQRVAMPARLLPELLSTQAGAPPPSGPALPFAPGPPSALPAAGPPSAPRSGQLIPELAETAAPSAEISVTLPFNKPSRAAAEPRLTLDAYATVCAEVAVQPAAAASILARHGLTHEGKLAEDEAWKARFAAEPALRGAWLTQVSKVGARLRGGG